MINRATFVNIISQYSDSISNHERSLKRMKTIGSYLTSNADSPNQSILRQVGVSKKFTSKFSTKRVMNVSKRDHHSNEIQDRCQNLLVQLKKSNQSIREIKRVHDPKNLASRPKFTRSYVQRRNLYSRSPNLDQEGSFDLSAE
mmetsp:Transcript_32149/g.31562  ORF Transcript_32149/g.31562 Transcript_32149/m.31562 type:complete len:143 (+) Transcript_32149:46-474(+)